MSTKGNKFLSLVPALLMFVLALVLLVSSVYVGENGNSLAQNRGIHVEVPLPSSILEAIRGPKILEDRGLWHVPASNIEFKLDGFDAKERAFVSKSLDLLALMDLETAEDLKETSIVKMSLSKSREVGSGTVNFEKKRLELFPEFMLDEIYGAHTIFHEYYHLKNHAPKPRTSELIVREKEAHKHSLEFYEKVSCWIVTIEHDEVVQALVTQHLAESRVKVAHFSLLASYMNYVQLEMDKYKDTLDKAYAERWTFDKYPGELQQILQMLEFLNSNMLMDARSGIAEQLLILLRSYPLRGPQALLEEIQKGHEELNAFQLKLNEALTKSFKK